MLSSSAPMAEELSIDPSIRLDHTTERKGESHQHWAIKAALIDQFRANPAYKGEIQDEKKTGELIADIRCDLSDSPEGVPKQFVVEIQTGQTRKNVVGTTRRHLRFGFGVYWVFQVGASANRREAESALSEFMSSRPSLGVASLSDGELSVGSAISWSEFDLHADNMARNEFYISTYERSAQCFNHGTFEIADQRFSIYNILGEDALYVCWHRDDGQQTLPKRIDCSLYELTQSLTQGDLRRVSPVGGSP